MSALMDAAKLLRSAVVDDRFFLFRESVMMANPIPAGISQVTARKAKPEVSMSAALAHDNESGFASEPATRSRSEVLARYRHLREISKKHNLEVLSFLSRDTVLHYARRLGLAIGRTLVVDSMSEMTLAFDLAIHTAPAGHSRAIDRYARSARFAEDSDEALVLEAMCNARFAVIIVKGRHPSAGLIVTDMFRNTQHWLVDEGLETCVPDGTAWAIRYYRLHDFIMTAGVCLPADRDLLVEALESAPHLLRKSHVEALADRRFAEAIYRTAIADGAMERIFYEDPPASDAA